MGYPLLLNRYILYSLIISRVKFFADFKDFLKTTKNLTLNFCLPLQFNTVLQLSAKMLFSKLQNLQGSEIFHLRNN